MQRWTCGAIAFAVAIFGKKMASCCDVLPSGLFHFKCHAPGHRPSIPARMASCCDIATCSQLGNSALKGVTATVGSLSMKCMFDYRELRAACFRLISDFDHSWFAACMGSQRMLEYVRLSRRKQGRTLMMQTAPGMAWTLRDVPC